MHPDIIPVTFRRRHLQIDLDPGFGRHLLIDLGHLEQPGQGIGRVKVDLQTICVTGLGKELLGQVNVLLFDLTRIGRRPTRRHRVVVAHLANAHKRRIEHRLAVDHGLKGLANLKLSNGGCVTSKRNGE